MGGSHGNDIGVGAFPQLGYSDMLVPWEAIVAPVGSMNGQERQNL